MSFVNPFQTLSRERRTRSQENNDSMVVYVECCDFESRTARKFAPPICGGPDIVLEFVAGGSHPKFGETLYMDGATTTTLDVCASWIADQLSPHGVTGHRVRMLLGDFGERMFEWGPGRGDPRCNGTAQQIESPVDSKRPASIGDFLCHDQPIMVTYEQCEEWPIYDLPDTRMKYPDVLTSNQTIIKLKPSDTVADVKAKIQRKKGIPLDHQRYIRSKERQMYDATTLSEYRIGNESTLRLVMNFRVRTLNGKTVLLDVEPSDTIDNVKTKFRTRRVSHPTSNV